MRNRTLAIDFLIAAVATIVLVIVSPGLAVVGLVAVLVLVVCGLTYLVDAELSGMAGTLPTVGYDEVRGTLVKLLTLVDGLGL